MNLLLSTAQRDVLVWSHGPCPINPMTSLLSVIRLCASGRRDFRCPIISTWRGIPPSPSLKLITVRGAGTRAPAITETSVTCSFRLSVSVHRVPQAEHCFISDLHRADHVPVLPLSWEYSSPPNCRGISGAGFADIRAGEGVL